MAVLAYEIGFTIVRAFAESSKIRTCGMGAVAARSNLKATARVMTGPGNPWTRPATPGRDEENRLRGAGAGRRVLRS